MVAEDDDALAPRIEGDGRGSRRRPLEGMPGRPAVQRFEHRRPAQDEAPRHMGVGKGEAAPHPARHLPPRAGRAVEPIEPAPVHRAEDGRTVGGKGQLAVVALPFLVLEERRPLRQALREPFPGNPAVLRAVNAPTPRGEIAARAHIDVVVHGVDRHRENTVGGRVEARMPVLPRVGQLRPGDTAVLGAPHRRLPLPAARIEKPPRADGTGEALRIRPGLRARIRSAPVR